MSSFYDVNSTGQRLRYVDPQRHLRLPLTDEVGVDVVVPVDVYGVLWTFPEEVGLGVLASKVARQPLVP